MKNLNNNSFIILSFIFDEYYTFNVEINNKPKNILNTSNIFLDYNSLSSIENNSLKINISYIRNNMTEVVNNAVLIFRLFESNSISILQKNNLNIGFTISNKVKQYYYLEVFKGEEGEIMLHDKRFYGELYGVIKPKSRIKPYNETTEYIKKASNSKLKFDNHILKLSFKSKNTKKCEEGCYLLITYTHDNFEFNQTIGSEFTLLVRIWDKEEIGSQIINIPFNEYIFGAFDENSIVHHYYSLSIPKNTEAIYIQFEGNYIDGFIGNGKKIKNTLRAFDNTKNLNITEKKMILICNKTILNDLKVNDSISFAFRSKNYFFKTFSFYYIRILLKEIDKFITYILDSNIGNICIPEKNKDRKEYFCKCRLKNNYKELSLDNCIATSNEIEKIKIDNQVIINKASVNKEGNLIKIKLNESAYYIDFIFIFKNSKNVNILSNFFKKKSVINPQIYSSEMFYLKRKMYFNFNLQHTFSLISNYIDGDGKIKYKDITIKANINFQGKPLLFPISKSIQNISFTPKEINENKDKALFFFAKLNYINLRDEVKEINLDKTLIDIMKIKSLPTYYYLKCEEGNSKEQININFRIINFKYDHTTFDIKGYLVNQTKINILNKNKAINGSYDTHFNIGILNIKNCNNSKYIMIKIDSSFKVSEEGILIEILAMSKIDKSYLLLPINKYITDIYNSNENKEYLIKIIKKNMKDKNISVEFIPNCNEMKLESDTKLNLEKDINYGMVQKYMITEYKDNITLKIRTSQNISNCYFLLRYYYSAKQRQIKYSFNEKYNIKKGKNKQDIILDFNGIKIINNKDNIKAYFKIYGLLYKYENDIKYEFMNSSSQNEITRAQTNLQKKTDFNFNLSFNDIKTYDNDNDNYTYYLKIIIYSREKNNILIDEFSMYTLKIDLTDIFKNNKQFIIIIIFISTIIIIIIIFTIIILILKKKNSTLKEKVNDISFSLENINEDILEKNEISSKDEDKENIFI